MKSAFVKGVCCSLTALALQFAASAPAHAGLVTGNWDPAFGPFLPNLSWSAQLQLIIPDACSNQADGVYATTGSCAVTAVQQIRLYLYDTNSSPSSYFELGTYGWNFDQVRVQAGQIVGFDVPTAPVAELTRIYDPSSNTYFSLPTSAFGNTFQLSFNLNGSSLTCLHCSNTFTTADNYALPNQSASTQELKQFLVTYTDDAGTTPKFTNGGGNALGALLDGNGNYLGQGTSIDAQPSGTAPEPGTLALALAALVGSAAATRLRRGRGSVRSGSGQR